MANLKYWLWLTTRKGLTPQWRQAVLEHFGTPEGAYFADEGEYSLIRGLSRRAIQTLSDKSLVDADRVLGDCDRLGIHIMTMQDAIYPERLRAIYQPPMVLYWKGREVAFDGEAAVAVVGTREATPYGVGMAEQISFDLTKAGALVVSGMAQGIDAAAVRGALKAGGPVVSVLGNGLDVVYPTYHRELYQDVAAVGTLMSEYPPGTRPKGEHFPVRNRILSGLSVGVVVVESPSSGGSLLTAGHALDQNRDVFAVPGPAGGVNSKGTNRLIQEGAKLIMGASDVLDELAYRFPARFAPRPLMEEAAGEQRVKERGGRMKSSDGRVLSRDMAEKEVDNPPTLEYIDWKEYKNKMTDDQRNVLLALENGPQVADELVEHTRIPAQRVLSALTMLQLQGLAVEESGKRFRAAVRLKME